MPVETTASQEELICAVYPEVRALAGNMLRRERKGHTLQRTALAHEALMRLLRMDTPLPLRAFIAAAAHQMRRILVDYGRRRASQKRGGEFTRVPLLEEGMAPRGSAAAESLLALDQALERLGRFDRRALAVVELKFFGGCTNAEAAEILGLSDGTIEADWQAARSWLLRELTRESC